MLKEQHICKFLYESEHGAIGISTVLMAVKNTDLPSACQVVISDDKEFVGIYGVAEYDKSQMLRI